MRIHGDPDPDRQHCKQPKSTSKEIPPSPVMYSISGYLTCKAWKYSQTDTRWHFHLYCAERAKTGKNVIHPWAQICRILVRTVPGYRMVCTVYVGYLNYYHMVLSKSECNSIPNILVRINIRYGLYLSVRYRYLSAIYRYGTENVVTVEPYQQKF
jgi:hypothetical protein